MENNNNTTEFIKARTAGKTLSDGIAFFFSNFKSICFSLQFLSLVALFGCLNAVGILFVDDSSIAVQIVHCAIVLVMLFVICLRDGYCVRVFQERVKLGYVPRLKMKTIGATVRTGLKSLLFVVAVCIPLAVVMLLVGALGFYLFGGPLTDAESSVTNLVVLGVLVLLLLIVGILLSVPVYFSYCDYMLAATLEKPNGLLRAIKYGFTKGFSKWGRIFPVVFVCGLISLLLCALLFLTNTSYYLSVAEMNKSIALGEEAFIPGGIKVFYSLFGFVQTFVMFGVNMALSFPLMLIYSAMRREE
ncbi:MAG: hypothetical protein IKP63_00145 [Paludibacteraceae bacterium]|nr:hypothetical protein [Paludibacteraceae bacterium]MBR6286116.1 hypothetical protein [Bacteroidaceae bacterium]